MIKKTELMLYLSCFFVLLLLAACDSSESYDEQEATGVERGILNAENESPGCGRADCNVPGPYFPLADTGHRACFDNKYELESCPTSDDDDFYGQDAQYGWDADYPSALRYVRIVETEGEPIVEDNVTGLTWQGCTAGNAGDDCSETEFFGAMKWNEALRYCNNLNWGGYTDWRLPDEFALQSILDLGVSNPAIDTDAFPATVYHHPYWSSATEYSDDRWAWMVFFSTGVMYTTYKDVYNYARCVREGTSAFDPDRYFRDTSHPNAPVVTDSATGLVWQGCTGGQSGDHCSDDTALTMTWQESLAYCETLTWAGHDDWRLPNENELHSISNNRTYRPAIERAVFPKTLADDYWSSSTYVLDLRKPWHSAWLVDFLRGARNREAKQNHNYARCVRSEQ